MQLKQQLAASVYLRIRRYSFCAYAYIYTDIQISIRILSICTNMSNAHARAHTHAHADTTHCTTTSTTSVHTLIRKEGKLKKKRANEKTLVHMVGELEDEV